MSEINELEQLTKKASEILGSEEQGKAFVNGLITKMASDPLTFGQALTGGAAKAMGGAMVGLAAGGLLSQIGKMVNQSERAKLHVKFQAALNQVKAGNRIVKAAPIDKVNNYANTIFNFAPHVATDPNLLGSLLANVIQGESIDPMTIKMLTDLEGRYTENSSFSFPKL